MDEFELYLDDLKPAARKKLLKFLGLKSAEEGNLDVLPLAVIPKPEPAGNVELICSECAEKRYKNKGKFTKEALKDATHVKKLFGREHMWVKVKEVRDDCVVGTVDNIPVLEDIPRYGEEVKVLFNEIEDVLLEKRKRVKGRP